MKEELLNALDEKERAATLAIKPFIEKCSPANALELITSKAWRYGGDEHKAVQIAVLRMMGIETCDPQKVIVNFDADYKGTGDGPDYLRYTHLLRQIINNAIEIWGTTKQSASQQR